MMGEVLIKNVEMPMHCAMCGFHGAMGDPMISQHFCKITGEKILNPYKGRIDNCPLVYVPPHGNLIDANKLVELCDIMADKCDGIGKSIWHQFKTTVEWSPIVIQAEEDK